MLSGLSVILRQTVHNHILVGGPTYQKDRTPLSMCIDGCVACGLRYRRQCLCVCCVCWCSVAASWPTSFVFFGRVPNRATGPSCDSEQAHRVQRTRLFAVSHVALLPLRLRRGCVCVSELVCGWFSVAVACPSLPFSLPPLPRISTYLVEPKRNTRNHGQQDW